MALFYTIFILIHESFYVYVQAPVQSRVCTDLEGEVLHQGLGDKSNGSVESLIALIDEDYPFEHNTWFGGVKAEDVKQKKCRPQTSEGSEDNVPAAAEKENVPSGGVGQW